MADILNSPSLEVIPRWIDSKILSRLGVVLADRLWFKISANVLSVFAILRLLWNFTKRFRRVNHWDLKGKVAVVTGASRGVGKGIAIALGEAGAIVYVTARTLEKKDVEQAKNDPNRSRNDINPILPGSIMETVQIIKERGGIAIPVQCDCSDDNQIKALFERIEKEQGRLDILVNNAINIRTDIKQTPPFWNQPIEIWDAYHGVGLRNHYVASVYGVPLMLKSQDSSKLIVNISSPGAKNYMFNVSYGSAKAALDKMSHDMAVELKKQDIVCVGLWPGLVKTERMLTLAENFRRLYHVDVQNQGETPEFTGRAICAIYSDPHAMKHAGKILDVVNLSHEYNFTDVDGRQPPQMLTLRFYLETAYYMFKGWMAKKQQ